METEIKIVKVKKKNPAKKKDLKKAIAKKGVKKITKLKVWMMENGWNQRTLSAKTEISTGTLNRLVNNGKASKSIIKSLSNELGISFEELNGLLEFIEPISK